MKHLRERGEIATILTLGVLVVMGIAAVTSSFFLNQKKTTGSQAAVQCDDPKWKCGPECASQEVRNVYSQNSDKWRAEAGKIYGGCDKENQPIPPTPSCPGKYDNNGSCNPACCNSDSQCSDGQKCNIPNGFCKSTTSCNPNKEAKFHTTCVGGACVKQACPDTGTCVDDCSSCSGGSTGSSGTTAGDPTRCPGADNTWVDVNEVRGNYKCCAAKNNPKDPTWNWATWSDTGKCIKDVSAGNTTGNCLNYGDNCKSECPNDKPGWSCQGTQCCPPGANSTAVSSPPPASSSINCNELDCGKSSEGSYWSRTDKNKKLLGYYKEDYLCKDSRVLDSGISSLETVKREKCGGTICTDTDYRTAGNGLCGDKDGTSGTKCAANEKKYIKSSTTCSGDDIICKKDLSCDLNSQTTACYEDHKGYCANDGTCKEGETSYYKSNCGDSTSGRTCCIPPPSNPIPPTNSTGTYTIWYNKSAFPSSANSKIIFSITMSKNGGGYTKTANWSNPLFDGYYTFTDLPFGEYNLTLTSVDNCPDSKYVGSTATATINKSGDNGRNTLSWTKSKCDLEGPPAQAVIQSGSADGACTQTSCSDTCNKIFNKNDTLHEYGISYKGSGDLAKYYQGGNCSGTFIEKNKLEEWCQCRNLILTTVKINNNCSDTITMNTVGHISIYKDIGSHESIQSGDYKECSESGWVIYKVGSKTKIFQTDHFNCSGLTEISIGGDMCK